MNRPLVKICGVTREEEIAHLAELSVDFFGLVTGVPSPWTINAGRAAQLAAHGNPRLRPTLVAGPQTTDALRRLIAETGATAIQLGLLTLPKHIEQLRKTFPRDCLTVIQHLPYRQGQFVNQQQAADYVAAGADFLLLDHFQRTADDRGQQATISEDDLIAFRERHQGLPLLVAGGVTAANVRRLLAASGATGIDVCSSVRHDGVICRELVAKLMARVAEAPATDSHARPSLDGLLTAAPVGNQVIAYLTIGDPPDRFVQAADDALAAGAVSTLELGFPHVKPKEGPTLLESHRRALAAGVDEQRALDLFQTVARRHPKTPLVAVVQAAAIQTEADRQRLLDGLAEAGAAAVLPVGLPLWQLPATAGDVDRRGMQMVFPCPPDASHKFRAIAFSYCSGCVYVPRGRTTGGGREFGNVAEFCQIVASETQSPIVVGVGVKTADDVAEICRTPAKAAAVGSALVEHLAKGGLAGDFIRGLIAHGEATRCKSPFRCL